MQRLPLGRYIAGSVIIWGAVLATTAATSNYGGLMTTRFFLGAMEGAVTAGFVLITSRWYKATEQAFRTGVSFVSRPHIFGINETWFLWLT
jgi:ACS family allantoate permease-like MFS transporter